METAIVERREEHREKVERVIAEVAQSSGWPGIYGQSPAYWSIHQWPYPAGRCARSGQDPDRVVRWRRFYTLSIFSASSSRPTCCPPT